MATLKEIIVMGMPELPPLTDLEREIINIAREHKSVSPPHLADKNAIDPKRQRQVYDTLRRVAKKRGLLPPPDKRNWIGALGMEIIYGEEQ
jgi:hypothetical protein